MIRLTKEFRFEGAHCLWNYDGPCKNIHGHSYILKVTIIGMPESDEDSKHFGMVMDFTDLKNIVNSKIIDKYDHSFVVYKKKENISSLTSIFPDDKIIISDYQPTCENLIIDFASAIKKELPNNVKLFSLKLNETATSFAEWYASDNE